MTSIRTISVHHGTFVHPENNLGLNNFDLNYGSALWYMGCYNSCMGITVVHCSTHAVLHCVILALVDLALGRFRLKFEV